MKSILEIPVFASHAEYFLPFITSKSDIPEKRYSGFSIYDFELDNDHSIWFFLFEEVPSAKDNSHIDRIIPKAPFSLLITHPQEGFNDSPTGDMFLEHINNYMTPLMLLAPASDEAFQSQLTSDVLFVEHKPALLLFDENNPQTIHTVMSEAIKLAQNLKAV